MDTNNVVIEYSVTDAAIAELRNKFSGLVVPAGDNKAYKTLTSAIAEVRTLRTDVEATRKNLKEDALKYGRMVDAEAKRITDLLVAIEQPLKEQKAAFDEAVEKARQERHLAEQKRISDINMSIAAIHAIALSCGMLKADELRERIAAAQLVVISESEFAEFVESAGNAKDKAINTLRKALTARIAADEAEAARIAEQARIDAERKAEAERLAAEQARLAAERAEFDRQQAEARRQQEAADRIRREAEAAEQEKRDAEARAQQAELDRQRAELKAAQDALAEQQRKAAEDAQREADAKAKEEQDRAAKEAMEKLKAEAEAARPDRERMIAYVRQCLDGMPDVSTEIGKHYAADVREGLEALLVSWNVEVKEAA